MNVSQLHLYNPQKSCDIYFIQDKKIQTNPNMRMGFDSVSFTSKDLMSEDANYIFAQIEKSINSENFIGMGGEASVYKIKDTPYCVRFTYDVDDSNLKQYKKFFSLKPTVQEKTNHIIAKFGNNIAIMPFLKGTPVYTPDMHPNQAQQIAQQIADMPKGSFYNLLKQISTAYDNDMLFDCSWGNVIVNPEAQKLTAIDFNKSDEPLRLLSYTNEALVHKHTTLVQRKNYAGKLLSVVMDELSPDNKPFYNLNNLDFSRFIYKLRDKGVIENPKYADVFCKLFDEIKELKFSEIRGISRTPELEAKLKVANCLIKQLFSVK